MRASPQCRAARAQPPNGGFTLFETIIVLLILALVATGLITMQSKLWSTQSTTRNQTVRQDLTRACAERLLAIRRQMGYSSVTNTLCDGLGTTGGFPANPSVSLTDAAGTTITSCSSATCTASISISNTGGTVALLPLTLQMSSY